MANVTGGAGNDVLNGPTGSDDVQGNQGDDLITVGAGRNTVYGGMGNDTVQAGNGDNLIYGDLGADVIHVGNGNNTIYGGPANAGKAPFDGADFITTGSGNNLIVADAGDDTVSVGTGANTVYGGQGNDVLIGNSGNDLFVGGRGDDSLYGGDGNDSLYGGKGNDYIFGGGGDDLIVGGLGDDSARFTGTRASYSITRDAQGDLLVSGPNGNDIVSSVEHLIFDDGNYDAALLGQGNPGGGSGNDTSGGGVKPSPPGSTNPDISVTVTNPFDGNGVTGQGATDDVYSVTIKNLSLVNASDVIIGNTIGGTYDGAQNDNPNQVALTFDQNGNIQANITLLAAMQSVTYRIYLQGSETSDLSYLETSTPADNNNANNQSQASYSHEAEQVPSLSNVVFRS